MARPSAPVRYLVLIAALVCLLCAVCAHTQKPAETAQPTPVNPEANPPAAQPDAGPPEQKKFFPASKAPGFIIPREVPAPR